MSTKKVYEGEKSKVAWVLGMIAGFVPLIVRLKVVQIPEAGKNIWHSGAGIYGDFFSANKAIALGILTSIAMILFIVEYRKGIHQIEAPEKKLIYSDKLIMILLGTYLAFALLSTLFARSGTKMIALLGAPDRSEGLITLTLYVLIMMLAIYLGKEWWNIKLIYKILSIGAFILGTIGVAQFFGWDFLQSDGGKALMLPFEFRHMAADINFTFAGRVYATLFNPNYVGSYTAMLMPLSLTAVGYTYLYVKDKDKKFNRSILALIMVALWLTSYSRGGLLGGLMALLIMAIGLHKNIIKTKTQVAVLIVLAFVGTIGLNFASKGMIVNRIKTLPKEAVKFVSSDQAHIPELTDIRLENQAFEIDSNLPSFRIELEAGQLIMKDQQGNLVNLTEQDKRYTPEDPQYGGMYIEALGADHFRLIIWNPHQGINYTIYLVDTPTGFKIIGNGNQLYDVVDVPAWGFEGKERLGSSRGYIWSRTIPMIGDKWLLGYGLDTYAVNFPQHDIVGKIKGFGNTNIIVDKPHNLYLQTMVATGVPSMLILVLIFSLYTIRWVKHIRQLDQDDIRRWMSIGIFAALFGYLVAGLFNDSVVSVAPVFWILWGLGIGLTNSDSSIKIG